MHLYIHVHPAIIGGLIQFQKLVGNQEKSFATVYGRQFCTRNISSYIHMYISSLLNHIQNSESLNTIIYISVIVTVQFFVAWRSNLCLNFRALFRRRDVTQVYDFIFGWAQYVRTMVYSDGSDWANLFNLVIKISCDEQADQLKKNNYSWECVVECRVKAITCVLSLPHGY